MTEPRWNLAGEAAAPIVVASTNEWSPIARIPAASKAQRKRESARPASQ